MKILIVEDDPIAAAVLEALLAQLGHEVGTATDGVAAWRQFQTAPRRLVISDWMLPGLDGLELCRRIRAHGGEYTYFVLLSKILFGMHIAYPVLRIISNREYLWVEVQ